jgi:hypothetical protein
MFPAISSAMLSSTTADAVSISSAKGLRGFNQAPGHLSFGSYTAEFGMKWQGRGLPGTNQLGYAKIDSDMGRFEFDLRNLHWLKDLPGRKDLSRQCWDSKTPLTYHIHSKWTPTNKLQKRYGFGFGPEECGSETAGGHLDPSYACGPQSEWSSNEYLDGKWCTKWQKDNYKCSPKSSLFGNQCEAGDLSGKHGRVKSGSGKYGYFGPSSWYYKYLEPITYGAVGSAGYYYGEKYGSDDEAKKPLYYAEYIAEQERSIVVHCGDGTRAFCARLARDNTNNFNKNYGKTKY